MPIGPGEYPILEEGMHQALDYGHKKDIKIIPVSSLEAQIMYI